MRHLAFVILLATLFSTSSALASTCPWKDGGYCVDTLARETLKVIQGAADPQTDAARQAIVSKLALPEGQAAIEGLLGGGSAYFNFYDGLWSSGLFSDKKTVFDEATAAGGTKIGGVNLVVLGARTLQRMVDLKWLTMEQAQQILNGARKHD